MHDLKPIRTLLLATLLVPLMAGSLKASLAQFSERALWEAVTPDLTTIDFNDETATYATYHTASGLTLGGVQFVGLASAAPVYALWIVDPAYAPDHDHDSQDVLKGSALDSNFPRAIIVTLPAGINSFGVDLMTYESLGGTASPQTFMITLSTGDAVSNVQTVAQPGRAFVGVVSDDPITQATFILTTGTVGGTQPLMDNFSFGTVTATPEPHGLLLLGGGLVALGFLRRRGWNKG